jgi:hypothetical protein
MGKVLPLEPRREGTDYNDIKFRVISVLTRSLSPVPWPILSGGFHAAIGGKAVEVVAASRGA